MVSGSFMKKQCDNELYYRYGVFGITFLSSETLKWRERLGDECKTDRSPYMFWMYRYT
jgi:hypothetical protein